MLKVRNITVFISGFSENKKESIVSKIVTVLCVETNLELNAKNQIE